MKVAELMKASVHEVSMERLAVSHSVAPPPVAEETAVPAPLVEMHDAAVAQMVGDKVERKLKDRLRVELLAVDLRELQEELAAKARAMDAQMAAVQGQMMAGLQTPPPTPPQTPGGEHFAQSAVPAGVSLDEFAKSREDLAKMEEHRQAAKAALEAHEHSIKALEDENARLLDEITGIKAKDLEQDGHIESLGEDVDKLNALTAQIETDLSGTKVELSAVGQTAEAGMKLGDEAIRRLDKLDLNGMGNSTGGAEMTELEQRMEAAETELRRLSGEMDVSEAMDDQAKKLAELFSKKAGKDELAAGLHNVKGIESRLKAEMEGRAEETAGLIGQAKEEFQEGFKEVGVKVEKKADREWLDDFENSIREQMKKLAGQSGDKVSAEQMEAKLAALRKLLEAAMAGANDGKGSALAFRCLACDRPLPPKDDWKNKTRSGPAQSIRDGPPVDTPPLGAAASAYPPLDGTEMSDNVVLRGGFPMSASMGSPGESPSSHVRTSGIRSQRASVSATSAPTSFF